MCFFFCCLYFFFKRSIFAREQCTFVQGPCFFVADVFLLQESRTKARHVPLGAEGTLGKEPATLCLVRVSQEMMGARKDLCSERPSVLSLQAN